MSLTLVFIQKFKFLVFLAFSNTQKFHNILWFVLTQSCEGLCDNGISFWNLLWNVLLSTSFKSSNVWFFLHSQTHSNFIIFCGLFWPSLVKDCVIMVSPFEIFFGISFKSLNIWFFSPSQTHSNFIIFCGLFWPSLVKDCVIMVSLFEIFFGMCHSLSFSCRLSKEKVWRRFFLSRRKVQIFVTLSYKITQNHIIFLDFSISVVIGLA